MSEHMEEAQGFLEMARAESAPEWSSARAQVAQAEATLAVAEQLRIANLIAMSEMTNAAGSDLTYDALHSFSQTTNRVTVRPEIARALGLEVKS